MGKRIEDLKTMVDKTKVYTLDEAIALAKETSTVKFDASVEIHARLGIDPKKGDQQIRATVVLPHGTGKTKRIAAFVGPNDEQTAKDAGADIVCGEEDIILCERWQSQIEKEKLRSMQTACTAGEAKLPHAVQAVHCHRGNITFNIPHS